MLDVCAALLPALAASVYYFGTRVLAVTAVSVGCCVLFEFLSRIVMKRPQTVGDCSAAVTGLLLAYNLPATLPLWMVGFGALVAIVVVKQMFGGIGRNFVNPAIAARIVLLFSFAGPMTAWTLPTGHSWQVAPDAVASATPMAILGGGAETAGQSLPSLLQMFLGARAGSLGETCAAALLLGGLYLIVFKVISPIIPLTYLGTVAAFFFLAGGLDWRFTVYQLLGGGLLLGALFMATDYTTSPLTRKGKAIYGVGLGLLTAVIRLYGSLPEGVSFAILIMNILVPHIDALTAPIPFGKPKPPRKEGRRHAKA
jgi:electron transport complex protein RnfD